jgi:hypothetical protein
MRKERKEGGVRIYKYIQRLKKDEYIYTPQHHEEGRCKGITDRFSFPSEFLLRCRRIHPSFAHAREKILIHITGVTQRTDEGSGVTSIIAGGSVGKGVMGGRVTPGVGASVLLVPRP